MVHLFYIFQNHHQDFYEILFPNASETEETNESYSLLKFLNRKFPNIKDVFLPRNLNFVLYFQNLFQS